MPFNPFSAFTSKIFGGLSLALLVALGIMALVHKHDLATADKLRNEKATLSAKLAVSNASIAALEKTLAAYVSAGKASQVAQAAAIAAQEPRNADLQRQADAIRAEVAKGADGCETPGAIRSAKGL
jgi:hypothetical protein